MKVGSFRQPDKNEHRIVIWTSYILWGAIGLIYVVCEPVIGVSSYLFGLGLIQTCLYAKRMDEEYNMFRGQLLNIMIALNIAGWVC